MHLSEELVSSFDCLVVEFIAFTKAGAT